MRENRKSECGLLLYLHTDEMKYNSEYAIFLCVCVCVCVHPIMLGRNKQKCVYDCQFQSKPSPLLISIYLFCILIEEFFVF